MRYHYIRDIQYDYMRSACGLEFSFLGFEDDRHRFFVLDPSDVTCIKCRKFIDNNIYVYGKKEV